jgi:hypothetical protein
VSAVEELNAKRDFLKGWLEQFKKAQDVVQYVQIHLDTTEWAIQVLSNCPADMTSVDFANTFSSDYEHVTGVLPVMPDYDLNALRDSLAFSASGLSALYGFVSSVADMNTQEAQNYSDIYCHSYRELQNIQDRSNVVQDLLKKLNNHDTLDRFDRASKAYFAAKSSTGERTAAALEMRTLLDGVKGILFEKARTKSNENMTWSEMAKRLAKGVAGGNEQQIILNQEAVRQELIDRLSPIAKGWAGKSSENLDHLWTQLLDHIYIVLSLIVLK